MNTLGSTELKRLHRDWRRRTPRRLAIALDGVQGPFNVGAICRTAAAYRAEYLWLTGHGTGPENPKVGKTALGSERYLLVNRMATLSDVVADAHTKGFEVMGVELASGAQPMHEVDLCRDVCLVVGHEDHGISRDGLAACDRLVYLPQLGRIGSLNVATAAALAMYEWARQQWTDPTAMTVGTR